MTCPKCGGEMVVVQNEPMGKLHQCPKCLETFPQYFDAMDIADVVHKTEGGSHAG